MRTGNAQEPNSIKIVVARRQSYPRVPPELLLREYAGKFRLTGLSLASLLDAVTPRVTPFLPPFITRTDVNGGASNEFMSDLLKESARRPPVPRENIKERSVYEQEMEREASEAKRKEKLNSRPGTASSNTQDEDLLNDNNNSSFSFNEAVPSNLTSIELVRKRIEIDNSTNNLQVEEKRRFPRLPSANHDSGIEENEVLWGYDTGAVVHVNLRAFSAYLSVISRYESLPLRRRRRITIDIPKNTKIDNKLENSTSIFDQQGESTTELYIPEDDREDIFFNMNERPPNGVSLLGYHPVGKVCCLVYDARNDLAISGGSDGTLLVWDVHHRYRTALRERTIQDDDLRNARSTSQFSAYIQTRRLTQRLRHAHEGGITALATHCELLLSGGVDGSVKVWLSEELAVMSTPGAPPQYIERQIFHCRGWIRHIWCAPERNVQGDDVLITSENGEIIGLRGSTLSQHPMVNPSRGPEKILLDALRNPKNTGNKSEFIGRRRFESGKSNVNRSQLSWNLGPEMNNNSNNNIAISTSSSSGAGGGEPSKNISSNENSAFKLLHRGIITRALRVTKTLQTISEEARLARVPGSRFRVREESTSAITRIIPLIERNLFITLGYSPIVRFLDMTRLGVAAVVEHPKLTATSGENKRIDIQSFYAEQQKNDKLQSHNSNNNNKSLIKGGIKTSINSNNGEALRFIDVLYVNSCDYLILLDNRNTVFVWDNTDNKILTSWTVSGENKNFKNIIAYRLLPCGTRHYESGGEAKNGFPANFRKFSKPKRRESSSLNQPELELLEQQENDDEDEDEDGGTMKIPFFIACNTGLEHCEVEITTRAKLEFQAHQDTILGIFFRQTISSSLSSNLKESLHTFNGTTNSKTFESTGKRSEIFSRTRTSSRTGATSPFCFGSSIRDRDNGLELLEGESNYTSSIWFQNSLQEMDNNNRFNMLTCSVDGTIVFWGNSFEPIRIYQNKKFNENDVSISKNILREKKLLNSNLSPFDVPPRVIKNKRTGSIIEVQGSGCNDTTSFYYSTNWNLIITGHDDGSIRFWPCDKELATCVWHKGLHNNTVSGLIEACIAKSEEQRRIYALKMTNNNNNNTSNINSEKIQLLATISFDGYLSLWEFPDESKAQPYGNTHVSYNELLCVAFDEINELFIVGDSGGVISSWNARDLEPRRRIPSRPPSPWQPTVSSPLLTKQDFPIWQTKKNNEMQEIKTKRLGHTEAVTSLLVDGNFVFSGGEDGRAFLWNLKIGTLVREYFLFHDFDTIIQHQQDSKTISYMYNSTMYSNYTNPALTSSNNTTGKKIISQPRTENITCMVLFKKRHGDFIIATREGWIYHFKQKDSYPISIYKHNSSVKCICILHEGYGGGKSDPRNDTFGARRFFEIAVGGEDGEIAVIREPHFSAIF